MDKPDPPVPRHRRRHHRDSRDLERSAAPGALPSQGAAAAIPIATLSPDTQAIRPSAFRPESGRPRRASNGTSKPRSDRSLRTEPNHPGKQLKPEGGPRWRSITKT